MISRSTVDAVFEAARVEEVIGDFVQLKKSGSNYKGLSPFSDERSPSFMVSPVKQIWKDFSSGKGGNAVSFIMEHEHFTFPEAIKWLAKRYGIEVEETAQTNEQKQIQDDKESMYLVAAFAAKWFHEQLATDLGAAIGTSYFKERGFTDETIAHFQLGYSPDAWSALTDEAIQAGYNLDYLERTGLTIVKEDKKFDRFKGRVMFPIRSHSGRVLGFGGRILIADKKAAKYLNSPQSDIYDKSRVLYGIYEAKQAIAKEDLCYLVEGYTDVIQLHQAGVKNVVSSSGTALTEDQIRLIARLTKNITVLYDGDAAGMRAAIRGIDLILEAGMNVRVCTFPQGEDPDSFAKSHTQLEIETFLKDEAVDFIKFKSGLLKDEAAGDPIKKAGMIREIVTTISKIPDNISREVYVRETAQILDISEDVLFATLAQMRNAQIKEDRKKEIKQQQEQVFTKQQEPQVEPVDRLKVLENEIIKIVLKFGNRQVVFDEEHLQEQNDEELIYEPVKESRKIFEKFYFEIQPDELEFSSQRFIDLYRKIIDILLIHEDADFVKSMSLLEQDEAEFVSKLVMQDEKYMLHDWESKQISVKTVEDVLDTLVTEICVNYRYLMIDFKIKSLYKEVSADSAVDNTEILEQIRNYLKLQREIAAKLGRVVQNYR